MFQSKFLRGQTDGRTRPKDRSQHIRREEMNSETTPSITSSKAKATNWIITLNNPTELETTAWTNIKQNHFVKEAQGQLEVGEEGTPHIQGYIKTESVRFSQIKKLFPRAHIEIAKNAIAARQYCVKESTREHSLPVTQLNTSIHRAVYNQTLLWFQTNLFDTDTGQQTRWAAAPSEEFANFIMLQQVHLLDEQTREWIYDRAVSQIIRSGVRHIEFVAVNNITRSAFLRYFPSLIHRENGVVTQEIRNEVEVAQSEASQSSQENN